MTTTVDVDPGDVLPGPGAPPGRRGLRGRVGDLLRRRPDLITGAVVVALLGFVLGGIGLQLAGVRVLADTSSLTSSSVYRDGGMPQSASGTLGLNDTIDAATPSEVLFGDLLRSGDFAAWNPYAVGGAPLAATPNYGLTSPLALPFWVLPGWLAPAYVKLFEIICAVGGTYLFLRRLRLSPAAATLGGLVFGSSAFLVAWTGWPQTRTAAVIPVLFWALERLVVRLRWREVALVALAVAALLLGGFPSVTGYALLTGAIYLAVRLLATRPWSWRLVLGRAAGALGGVVAGVALTAWQLLPWAQFMTTALVRGREQEAGRHVPVEALLTTIAPYALGTANARSTPTWFAPGILVEGESYVGAAALVLVLTAIALATRGRGLLPRGVWWFLVVATLGWGVVIFLGGFPLALLQQTGYLFADNFIGRARSVLGLLLAALAAVGFELLLRRRRVGEGARPPRPREPRTVSGHGRRTAKVLSTVDWSRVYGAGVWVAAAVAGAWVYVLGHRMAVAAGTTTVSTSGATSAAQSVSDAHHLTVQVGIGLALVGLSAVLVAALWWGRPGRSPRWATVALVLVPVLVAGPALAWVVSYYPHSRRSTFYPTNDVQAYLSAHLGHERFFGAFGSIYGSVETIHGLRQFHGHGFMESAYGDLVDALPGRQFLDPPNPATLIRGETGGGAVARSPILDRASVTEYVIPPEMAPFGDLRTAVGDGSSTTLSPGRPLTVRLPVTGPVRGVGVTPVAAGITQTLRARIEVTLRDPAGTVVASAARVDRNIRAGAPFVVALAADTVAAGTILTATITLQPFGLVGAPPAPRPAPIALAAANGQPVLSVVTPTSGDGLHLVFDGQSQIYQRTRALPRARWASSTVVQPDPDARLALLASGTLRPDQVVLDSAGPATDGRPATVDWVDDGVDEMTLRVSAEGAGYLVLADAIQANWKSTVDGRPATIVAADHAFVAVAVPAGTHEIHFSYPPPLHTAGAPVSAAAAMLLLGAVGLEAGRPRWRRRHARR